MGILYNKVAERVFNILKGQSYAVTLFDESGERVYSADEARMFFASPDKIMVNVTEDGDDSSIRVNISKTQKITAIKDLLAKLRLTATHFGLLFTVRTYAKDLKPKDFAFLASPKVEESIQSEGTLMKKTVEGWEDLQATNQDAWDSFINSFDVKDFVDYLLKDLIGHTDLNDIPESEREELIDALKAELPDSDHLVSYLSRYASVQTDGEIEDLENSGLEESVYEELSSRGFDIKPNSAKAELDAFESWVGNFEPSAILSGQQQRELAKQAQTKRKIEEMREKISQAKADREKLKEAKKASEEASLFETAYKITTLSDDPLSIRQICEPLSEKQIHTLIKMIGETWAETVSTKLQNILEDVIEIKQLTRTRIAESKTPKKTVKLVETDDLSVFKALAGISAPPTQQVMVPPTQTDQVPTPLDAHKEKLVKDVQFLLQKLAADQTFAERITSDGAALVYITWDSADQRTEAEKNLLAMGHYPSSDYWLGSNTSEVPLGTYGGFSLSSDAIGFNEAVEDSEDPSFCVFMNQPYDMEKADEADALARNLHVDYEFYYPTLANGLLFKCATKEAAQLIVDELTQSDFEVYLEDEDNTKVNESALKKRIAETKKLDELSKDTLQAYRKKLAKTLDKGKSKDLAGKEEQFWKATKKLTDLSNRTEAKESKLVEFNNSYDRYSYEEDSLGNIIINDIDTDKSVYLQGEEADELLGQIHIYSLDEPQNTIRLQNLLSQYEHVMESDSDFLQQEASVAFKRGRQARIEGKPLTANPWEKSDPSFKVWAKGWKSKGNDNVK